ncbi:MAG: TonB-dependent receptor plug domain-containing protein [Bacteroidota bacterium]|nr:TonB-dependent receptor plug domain-containing protein [Bacteroidota bacterium]
MIELSKGFNNNNTDRIMRKKLRKYSFVLGIFLLGFPFAGFCQMINDTVKIEEVEIFFQRDISEATINSIEIDSLIIAHYSMGQLSELLSANSSVNIRDYGPGSISTLSMRGSGPSHTVVQWNGISLNSPLTGQVDFSLIPVAFTDKILLTHGNGSLQNQSGGLGGCVSLVNKSSFEKGFHVKLGQEKVSFGSNSVYSGLKWSNSKWSFGNRFTFAKAKNNFPYWRNIPLGKERVKQINAETGRYGILQEVYYRPNNKNVFSLLIWHENTEREIPPLKTFNGSNHDEVQYDISTRAVVKWQTYEKNSSWQLQSAMVRQKLDYHLYHYPLQNIGTDDGDLPPIESIVAADTENKSISWLNRMSYSFSKNEIFKLNFRLDLNRHSAKVKNNADDTGFVKNRTEVSAFFGIYRQIGSRLVLSFMGRNSFLDLGDYQFAPLLGFEYKLHKRRNWKLKGNIARNYHYPSMNDLYYIPGGNPDLKPEQGISEELSLHVFEQIADQDLEINLTAFASHISNWILWAPTQFGWWTPENKEKVFSRGIESNILLKGKAGFVDYAFNFGFSLSHTTSEQGGDSNKENGEQLIYVPGQTAHGDFNLKSKGYSFRYATKFTGIRHTSYGYNRSFYDLPAFFLHSVSIGKNVNIKKIKAGLTFQINNIFNIDYESIRQRAMPGRNYGIKIFIKI